MESPVRSAAIQSALATRTPEVVPFQVKMMSCAGSMPVRSGSSPYAAAAHGGVLELELLDDVGHPTFAEGFPGEHGYRTRSEQRPKRHFDGAGVGRRHDADAIRRGDLKDLAGQIDGALELGFAGFRAVRASEDGVAEGLRVPAGALGTGAGGKMRHKRPHGGHGNCHHPILPDSRPSLGRGVPPLEIGQRTKTVKSDG